MSDNFRVLCGLRDFAPAGQPRRFKAWRRGGVEALTSWRSWRTRARDLKRTGWCFRVRDCLTLDGDGRGRGRSAELCDVIVQACEVIPRILNSAGDEQRPGTSDTHTSHLHP